MDPSDHDDFLDAGGPRRPACGVSQFGELALWMAASLAGMVTGMLARRAPFFRSLLKRLGQPTPSVPSSGGRPSKPSRKKALPMLADAIVGSTKSAVASVFGPPRTAVLLTTAGAGSGGTQVVSATDYYDANTWYYPLPRKGPVAMAIEFDDEGSARRVEFLLKPRA